MVLSPRASHHYDSSSRMTSSTIIECHARIAGPALRVSLASNTRPSLQVVPSRLFGGHDLRPSYLQSNGRRGSA
jgi:hypothetical protein